jgi:pimeloyl-ACP methyl ester carboxylesterase
MDPLETRTIRLHGHDVAYRMAGEGPVLLLVHGIAGSSGTWARSMPHLIDRYTVIAPDLLGHGASAKPRGDYSLGAYASGVRDLLVALGHEKVTLVGHSLGGGIAMQFAYQFPQRCERLVLVSSGGLGKDVSLLLRSLTLPGAEYVLPLVMNRQIHDGLNNVRRFLGNLGIKGTSRTDEWWDSYDNLTDAAAQRAFVHTIRSVIDVSGQRVSARDRLYLASEVPTMVVWGAQDKIIPVEHARAACAIMPGCRLEIFEQSGHFLTQEEPERFAQLLIDFIETTEAADVDESEMRKRLIDHGLLDLTGSAPAVAGDVVELVEPAALTEPAVGIERADEARSVG